MASRVANDNRAVRGPLYTPVLGEGAHRLGQIGLSSLAGLGSERTYTPADNFNGAPTPRQITVGEYYRQRNDEAAAAVGNVLHGIVELAAPPVLLIEMAHIKGQHGAQARNRINNLPWDPEGRWMQQADRIKKQESAEANQEIRNLPLPTAARATGQAVVNGAVTVGHAVGSAFDAVGDYASNATTEAIESGRQTGRGIMRGLLSGIAMNGQSMFEFARRNKSAFE